jgi:hypothetical protein
MPGDTLGSGNTWGAAAVATGMWIIACVAVFGSEPRLPADGVVWTSTSSDKIASHPTLVRRSLPGTAAAIGTTKPTQVSAL